MKKLSALILALFIALPLFGIGFMPWLKSARGPSGGGGGGGDPVTISDNFNRSSSTNLGANWTEVTNDSEIAADTVLTSTTTSAWCVVVHNTPLSGTTQYGKLKLIDNVGAINDSGGAALIFRYTDASSPCYLVGVSGYTGAVIWNYSTDGLATDTSIASSSLAFASGDAFGVVVTGTGTSTVVRIWKNPSGDAPDTGGTTWGSASPDVTFTTDPAVEANTGLKVGIGMYGGAATKHWYHDDFFAGDVP